MRYLLISLTILIMLIVAGCSSSSNNPTQPASNPDLPEADCSFDGVALLYQGAFEIDLETQTITQIENRQSDVVYNITGFLPDKCPGGCFRFTIVGVVGTVLEIELTLENPLAIQVYDARVQYLDLFGKTVLNPDSYTDFLGTPISNVFPFTAFVKEDDNRAFPVGPGGIDTETMYLDFPPGSASSVNYAITASLPDQTLEPYEISEMAQTGTLTTAGGSATISCVVDDHQDDISGVYMDATPFTGAAVQLLFNDPMWEVEISNTAGAPVGVYNQLIMALSQNPQNISTYNYVEITVSTTGEGPVADIQADPFPDARTCQFISFDASGSSDSGGYNIVEYQWDWDYTGVPAEFNADRTTDTPFIKHQYSTEGSHLTALIVVNDAPVPQSSDIVFVTHNLTRSLPSEYSVQEINTMASDGSSHDIRHSASNSIVVDDDGVVHVLARNGSSLEHITYDDGVANVEVIGSMQSTANQSIQLDSEGALHVIWLGGAPAALNYSENSSGSFSTPVVLATSFDRTPSSYTLGINGQDELMVLYYSAFSAEHAIMYVFYNGTSWSAPSALTHPYYQTGSSGSELSIYVACAGSPGYDGYDFHGTWTQQFTEGYMNPVVTYSKFDRVTETWSTPEHAAADLSHYQDWPDISVQTDGDVFIGSSYYWQDAFVAKKDGTTGAWSNWWIANTSVTEYAASIAVNDDGTICYTFWERYGYPDPDPFEVMFKVFHEDMNQAEVDAIPKTQLDPDPSATFDYRYGDVFVKECKFYVAFMDGRVTPTKWDMRFGVISPD